MRILLAWYSRTGTTERIVRAARPMLEALGHEVVEDRVRPRLDLPYPLWLALSFVPGARVPIAGGRIDPAGFDACLLAVPKWTLACPPVNAYLARVGGRLPPTAIVLTCGGFDQARYLRALEQRVARMGARVLGGVALRRRHVIGGTADEVLREFLAGAFAADRDDRPADSRP
jgi:hypothetical protein